MKTISTLLRWDQIKALQSVHGFPLITLALPTHRSFPDNRQDRIRFKNLATSAIERIAVEVNRKYAEELNHTLEAIADRIDWDHTLDGLLVYVGNGVETVVYLPIPVRERVIVDKTFATRDLVIAHAKTLRYWVIALSLRSSKLFEGFNNTLREVSTEHFPFPYDGPTSGDPENPLP